MKLQRENQNATCNLFCIFEKNYNDKIKCKSPEPNGQGFYPLVPFSWNFSAAFSLKLSNFLLLKADINCHFIDTQLIEAFKSKWH